MGHQQTTVHGSTEGRNDGLPLDMGCHGMDGKLSKKSKITHTQEQSLPIFSGPMHVRRECALSDVLNPKKLRRLEPSFFWWFQL